MCLSSRSNLITIRVSHYRNLPPSFNKSNKRLKKRRQSWRLALRNSEPSVKEWQTLRKSIPQKRRNTMLSSSRWNSRRSKSLRTWALNSRSTKRANLSSTQIMCRLIFSRRSRSESSVRPSIFQTLTSAWCQTWRRSTSTSRSSNSSRRLWCVNYVRLRGTSKITVKTTATRWRSSKTCGISLTSRREPQRMAVTDLLVTRIPKPEDLTALSSENETDSRKGKIDTITTKRSEPHY